MSSSMLLRHAMTGRDVGPFHSNAFWIFVDRFLDTLPDLPIDVTPKMQPLLLPYAQEHRIAWDGKAYDKCEFYE